MLTQIFKLLQLNNMVTSVPQTDANEMFKKVGEIYDGIAAKDYTLVIQTLSSSSKRSPGKPMVVRMMSRY